MGNESRQVLKTTVLAAGLVIGWILGQAGTLGLALIVICLVAAAYSRGYRILIEKERDDS
jgi:hypothetical protein